MKFTPFVVDICELCGSEGTRGDCSCVCSAQILKPSEKKAKYQYGGMNAGRPITPPRTAVPPKKR